MPQFLQLSPPVFLCRVFSSGKLLLVKCAKTLGIFAMPSSRSQALPGNALPWRLCLRLGQRGRASRQCVPRQSLGTRVDWNQGTVLRGGRDEAEVWFFPDLSRGRLGDDRGNREGGTRRSNRLPGRPLPAGATLSAHDSLPDLLPHRDGRAEPHLLSTGLSHLHEGVP